MNEYNNIFSLALYCFRRFVHIINNLRKPKYNTNTIHNRHSFHLLVNHFQCIWSGTKREKEYKIKKKENRSIEKYTQSEHNEATCCVSHIYTSTAQFTVFLKHWFAFFLCYLTHFGLQIVLFVGFWPIWKKNIRKLYAWNWEKLFWQNEEQRCDNRSLQSFQIMMMWLWTNVAKTKRILYFISSHKFWRRKKYVDTSARKVDFGIY